MRLGTLSFSDRLFYEFDTFFKTNINIEDTNLFLINMKLGTFERWFYDFDMIFKDENKIVNHIIICHKVTNSYSEIPRII